MSKICLTFALLTLSLVLQNCNSTTPQQVNSEITKEVSPTPTQTPRENLPQSAQVEFKGVSFSYNPQIFGAVKPEEIAERKLEDKDDKPDYITPQNRQFTFDLATDFGEMYISVFPIDDFPKIYAVGGDEYVKSMESEVIDVKKVLKDKIFRVENRIPYLPYIDASQTFQAKVKHFNFSGGKGILFLTFWETQIEFPSNRQLRYVFEGLTDDEKYYVLAEMPVSVGFLPEDSSDEYEDYKIPWGEKSFNSEVVLKQMTEVNKKVAKRLEKLPQNEFEPNLNQLEKIISTLKIEK